MTSYERTGWRDEKISRRHRKWGFNCPAVDLDFTMVEYNLGKAVALVEYKHINARIPDIRHATYRALKDLADNYGDIGLPFFISFYDPDGWTFEVWPINDMAKRTCNEYLERKMSLLYTELYPCTELDYVTFLYRLRSRMIEDTVMSTLNTTLPKRYRAPKFHKSSENEQQTNLTSL